MNEQVELEKLTGTIRQVLPRGTTTSIEIDQAAKAVMLTYDKRRYVAQPSGAVFELKNQQLFITGVSTLIQAAISRRQRNEGEILIALEAVVAAIESRDKEFQLQKIGVAKTRLSKLAGVLSTPPGQRTAAH